MTDFNETQALIAKTCDEIKSLLLEKNRKYGNSALEPSRIFSKSDAVEQIKVRIDDKLTRLKNQQSDEDEDVVMDLMGYLVLLRVAQKLKEIDQNPIEIVDQNPIKIVDQNPIITMNIEDIDFTSLADSLEQIYSKRVFHAGGIITETCTNL